MRNKSAYLWNLWNAITHHIWKYYAFHALAQVWRQWAKMYCILNEFMSGEALASANKLLSHTCTTDKATRKYSAPPGICICGTEKSISKRLWLQTLVAFATPNDRHIGRVLWHKSHATLIWLTSLASNTRAHPGIINISILAIRHTTEANGNPKHLIARAALPGLRLSWRQRTWATVLSSFQAHL